MAQKIGYPLRGEGESNQALGKDVRPGHPTPSCKTSFLPNPLPLMKPGHRTLRGAWEARWRHVSWASIWCAAADVGGRQPVGKGGRGIVHGMGGGSPPRHAEQSKQVLKWAGLGRRHIDGQVLPQTINPVFFFVFFLFCKGKTLNSLPSHLPSKDAPWSWDPPNLSELTPTILS